MQFILSNGAPATFAVSQAAAEDLLGTSELHEMSDADLSSKDWAAIDAAHPNALWPDDFAGLRVFAVAC